MSSTPGKVTHKMAKMVRVVVLTPPDGMSLTPMVRVYGRAVPSGDLAEFDDMLRAGWRYTSSIQEVRK